MNLKNNNGKGKRFLSFILTVGLSAISGLGYLGNYLNPDRVKEHMNV
jgi:hypothetical protein